MQEFTLEQLVEQRVKAIEGIDQLDAARKVIDEEIVKRMNDQGLKGTVAGNYSVTKVTRVSFSTKLEEAKELGATKVVEQIDSTKLRQLHDKGVTVPGSRVYTYPLVKEMEPNDQP